MEYQIILRTEIIQVFFYCYFGITVYLAKLSSLATGRTINYFFFIYTLSVNICNVYLYKTFLNAQQIKSSLSLQEILFSKHPLLQISHTN